MNIVNGMGTASQAAGAIKDVSDAQVVTKTLDKMNTLQTISGPKIDAGYQMRKDMLSGHGIGSKLDVEV